MMKRNQISVQELFRATGGETIWRDCWAFSAFHLRDSASRYFELIQNLEDDLRWNYHITGGACVVEMPDATVLSGKKHLDGWAKSVAIASLPDGKWPEDDEVTLDRVGRFITIAHLDTWSTWLAGIIDDSIQQLELAWRIFETNRPKSTLISWILQFFRDGSIDEKEMALRCLRAFVGDEYPVNPEVLEAVLGCLQHREKSIRERAFYVLEFVPHTAAVGGLIQALGDDEDSVRRGARSRLDKIRENRGNRLSRPALRSLHRDEGREECPYMEAGAIWSLGIVQKPAPGEIAEMLKYVATPGDRVLPLRAVAMILRYWEVSLSSADLTALLDIDDPVVQTLALELYSTNPLMNDAHVIRRLFEHVGDSDSDVSDAAETAIKVTRKFPIEFQSQLLNLFDSGSSASHLAALKHLLIIGDLDETAFRRIVRLASSPHPGIQKLLQQFDWRGNETLWDEALDSAEKKARPRIWELIGNIRIVHPKLTERILAQIVGPASAIKQAMDAAVIIASESEDLVCRVVELLAMENTRDRGLGAAIIRAEFTNPGSLAIIKAVFESASKPALVWGFSLLNRYKGSLEPVKSFVEQVDLTPAFSSSRMTAAIDVLVDLRQGETICGLVSNSELRPVVRVKAIQAAVELVLTEAVPGMLGTAGHWNDELVATAVESLAALAVADSRVEIQLLDRLRDEGDSWGHERSLAVNSLVRLSSIRPVEGLGDTLSSLIDDDADEGLAETCLRALVRVEPENPRLEKSLLLGLTSENDTRRATAAELIPDLRSKNPELSDRLREIAIKEEDFDARLRLLSAWGKVDPKDPAVCAAIIAAAGDPREWNREAALKLLEGLPSVSVKEIESLFLNLLQDEDVDVQKTVIRITGSKKLKSPSLIDALLGLLDNEGLRFNAALALSDLDRIEEKVVKILAERVAMDFDDDSIAEAEFAQHRLMSWFRREPGLFFQTVERLLVDPCEDIQDVDADYIHGGLIILLGVIGEIPPATVVAMLRCIDTNEYVYDSISSAMSYIRPSSADCYPRILDFIQPGSVFVTNSDVQKTFSSWIACLLSANLQCLPATVKMLGIEDEDTLYAVREILNQAGFENVVNLSRSIEYNEGTEALERLGVRVFAGTKGPVFRPSERLDGCLTAFDLLAEHAPEVLQRVITNR